MILRNERRLRNIHTGGYHINLPPYLQCTYHKLHSSNGKKSPTFPGSIWQSMTVHLKHTTTKDVIAIEKGWYFRFDDDNKTKYKYILSVI